MPYKKKDELPEAVKGLPDHAQEIWMAAFNSALEQYEGDEEKCHAVAWAAVKKKYKKEDDQWVEIEKDPEHSEPWFEIFRTGTHTDSAGRTRDWSQKDLEEISSSYNPENHLAPIVIGHPEHDAPAYGWVESLKVEGDRLQAKAQDVADEFKDWVRKGLYKKVSIVLYPDMGLRHVGFLGATPPAIKGLKQAAFGDKKAAWEIETDFQYMDVWQQEAVKSIFQRLRDWLIDKFSLEEADKVISVYDINALTPEHPDVPKPVGSAYMQTGKGGKIMDLTKFFSDLKALVTGAEKELITPDPDRKFTEADVQARVNEAKEKAYAEAEKERREKIEFQERLRTIETERRRSEIHAFCESLAKDGKFIPAWQKMGIEEFIFNLDAGESIKFAEGAEKSRSQWFKDFLTELPKVVTFKEVAGDDKKTVTGGSAGEKLSNLTKEKMDKKPELSFGAAFIEVQRENPELAAEYQSEINPNKQQ